MDYISVALWGRDCGRAARHGPAIGRLLIIAAVVCEAGPTTRHFMTSRTSEDGGSLLQVSAYDGRISTDAVAEEDSLPEQPAAQLGKFRPNHLLGVLVDSMFSPELQTQLQTEQKGSFGVPMVFLICAACWVLELVLAKRWDTWAQVQDDLPEEPESRPVLHALSFARYLMAWHVVLNHFALGDDGHSKQASTVSDKLADFARWGVLAAPWFFIVSGFSNSYSKLVGPQDQRNEEEDFVQAMLKRVLSWYPFFLLALIWCAIRVATSDAEDWAHFTANMTLVHGWVWRDPTFPFLTGNVWLSWLVVYFLSWAPMHAALAEGSAQSKDATIWTVFRVSFLLAIPSAFLEWYHFSAPFFSMMQLWPSFIFGQALAFWFVTNCMQEMEVISVKNHDIMPTRQIWVRKDVKEIPVLARFGATISFLVFGTMFFMFSPNDLVPLFHKPVLPLIQKGFQLPLQGLMVVGLASEIDPIAKLFARRLLRFTEKLALMTYIFQVPVHNTVVDLTGWDGMTWTFAAALTIFTVAAHYALERPYRQWRGNRERGECWEEICVMPKKQMSSRA